jgi:Fe-coproporphyrin III synthase
MNNLSARLSPRLRAYTHVAQARLHGKHGKPPYPHATHMLVTWRCNLRCTGCDAWQHEKTEELTADQWAGVFRQLRFLDIIKMIGGEPFVRDDLADVIGAIRREVNPFIVQLVTNATMTDRVVGFAERHAWPGLHMRVSLDGLAETHDRSRGVPGTFDRVMETLRGLSQARRKKRFQLAVNFTLTDDSRPDMKPLIEICNGMGVDLVAGFKVKPFLKHCDIRKEKAETLGLVDRSAALQQLQASGHGARSGFNAMETSLLQKLNRVVFGKHAKGGGALKFRCGEVRNLMYLNPAGDLITCGLNQKPIGSIAREGFDAVWFSERAGAARAEVRQCPGCMQGAVEIMSRLYD